jgi:hypothetical protein
MGKGKYLFISLGAVAVLAVAVLAYWQPWSPSHAVRIVITGPPGLKIRGTCQAGGATLDFNGTVPNELHAHGRVVTASVEKTSEPGKMTVKVYLDDAKEPAAVGSTRVRGGIIRVEVKGGMASIWAEGPRGGGKK